MTGLRVFALVLVSTAVSQACNSIVPGVLSDAGIHTMLAAGISPEYVAEQAGCPDVASLDAYLTPSAQSFAVVSAPFQSGEGLTDGTFVSRMSFDSKVVASALSNAPLVGAWGASAALQLPEGCTVSGLGVTCGSAMNGSLAWSRVDWLNTGFDRSSDNLAFGRTSFSSFSGCSSFGGLGSLGVAGSASGLAIDGTRRDNKQTPKTIKINSGGRAWSRWDDRDDRDDRAAVRHELPTIGVRPDVSAHGLTRAERVLSKFER